MQGLGKAGWDRPGFSSVSEAFHWAKNSGAAKVSGARPVAGGEGRMPGRGVWVTAGGSGDDADWEAIDGVMVDAEAVGGGEDEVGGDERGGTGSVCMRFHVVHLDHDGGEDAVAIEAEAGARRGLAEDLPLRVVPSRRTMVSALAGVQQPKRIRRIARRRSIRNIIRGSRLRLSTA